METLTAIFNHAILRFNPTPEHDGVVIQTKAGPLWCRIYEEGQPWIPCRFEDVEKARKHFGVSKNAIMGPQRLNPCSGKWNFHMFEFAPRQKRYFKKERREYTIKMIEFFAKQVEELRLIDNMVAVNAESKT